MRTIVPKAIEMPPGLGRLALSDPGLSPWLALP
jgi:hypothetical protein